MLKLLCLTGTQNCRRSMWVGFDRASVSSTLSFYDFSSKELYEYSLRYVAYGDVSAFDVAPNFLVIAAEYWLSVLNVSNNKIIATLPFCKSLSDIFYLSLQNVLLVVFKHDIKYFKIHNLENCLKS